MPPEVVAAPESVPSRPVQPRGRQPRGMTVALMTQRSAQPAEEATEELEGAEKEGVDHAEGAAKPRKGAAKSKDKSAEKPKSKRTRADAAKPA